MNFAPTSIRSFFIAVSRSITEQSPICWSIGQYLLIPSTMSSTRRSWMSLMRWKSAFLKLTILALSFPRYRKFLKTDTCEYQVGYNLLGNVPIAYWILTRIDAEKNHLTKEEGFLEATWSILTLPRYFYIDNLILGTDNNALKLIIELVYFASRSERLRLRLAQFKWGMKYRPIGKIFFQMKFTLRPQAYECWWGQN